MSELVGWDFRKDEVPERCNMSTKTTGELRVGCGEYHCIFSPKSGVITQLSITIEDMLECPSQHMRI